MGRPFSFARGVVGRDSDGRSGFAGQRPSVTVAAQPRNCTGVPPRESTRHGADTRCRFTTIEDSFRDPIKRIGYSFPRIKTGGQVGLHVGAYGDVRRIVD